MKTNQAYVVIVHRQIWKGYISYYIMEHNGKAMIRITQEDNHFEISDLFVEASYRGQGLGSYMLDYAIDFSKRLTKNGTISISTSDQSEEFCDEWYQHLGFIFDHMETPLNLEDEELDWRKVYKMTF